MCVYLDQMVIKILEGFIEVEVDWNITKEESFSLMTVTAVSDTKIL